MKWLPNALTILRCILAFVVGWAILEMAHAFHSFDQSVAKFDELRSQILQNIFTPESGAPSMVDLFMAPRLYDDAVVVLPFLLFVLVAATDFIDGFAARKLNAVSEFGAWLDPIADKLLVAISLVGLCHVFAWWWVILIPTLAIVGRDVFITWLRSARPVSLPVTRLAKWKTAFEMTGIGTVLFAFASVPLIMPRHNAGSMENWLYDVEQFSLWITLAGLALIALAAALSLYTGYQYVRAAFSRPAP